jgi:hypothetical protein
VRFSHSHRLVLISNWKCGCSTMAALFEPITDFDADSVSECSRIFGKDYDVMCHYPASLMRQEFARLGWNYEQYTSISTVRNPWARTVSLFATVKNLTGFDGSFEGFVTNHLPNWQSGRRGRWNSYEMFHEQGRRIVDHIVRLEHLEQDLRPIVAEHWPDLRLDFTTRVNVGDHRPFRDYYSERTRQLVADFFTYDIEAFGYSFDDSDAG